MIQIGWHDYLKRKFQPKSDYFSLGIAITPDTVTFCALKKQADVISVFFEHTVAYTDWAKQLSKWVSQHKLQGTPAYIAFSLHWFQHLQVDKPDVEDNELHQALTWQAKDLVEGDKPFVMDYFDMPVPVAGAHKVNLIAIDEREIEKTSLAVFQAGLRLTGITIEELAYCDLLPASATPCITVIQEGNEEVVLSVVKDGHLYVSRRLKGFENLPGFSPEELQMGILDSLSVQVQRSMDYFESQLRQAPIRQIFIRLNSPHQTLLAGQIQQGTGATVTILEPAISAADTALSKLNFISLGAALAPARVNSEPAATVGETP